MRMVDVIARKRDGHSLSEQEIAFFVQEYTQGRIPDCQASALLMAICLQGMSISETRALSLEMARSGEMVDLSAVPGVKVDKHSTGGVGDKTSLIVGPLAASCGAPVAKMNGRTLGYMGGTLDKLESVPGFCTGLPQKEFVNIVKTVGVSIAELAKNLGPANRMLYALRSETGTLNSIPLIAASIMSMKLAAGADAIVLDVKTGSGSFMRTLDSARKLAREMVRIGEGAGKPTVALITDMNTPLGRNVGNSLEVIEAVSVLRGEGPADVAALSLELAANMLHLAGLGTLDACRQRAQRAIADGSALEKLAELVRAQGGDASCLSDTSKFRPAPVQGVFRAVADGYVTSMDCRRVGTASMLLGAGRETEERRIDFAAGIELLRKTGDRVQKGEPLARLYTSAQGRLDEGKWVLAQAFALGSRPPANPPLIYEKIDKESMN